MRAVSGNIATGSVWVGISPWVSSCLGLPGILEFQTKYTRLQEKLCFNLCGISLPRE